VEVSAFMDIAGEAAGVPSRFDPSGSYTGTGITVAVLDSGIGEHGDLAGRVLARVDMTGQHSEGDPSGHGTHVAGILAGDGSLSDGFYRGVAPGAGLVSVRVLGEDGGGKASDVIAGLEWVMANRDLYGIRIVNISLGHPVLESLRYDPLVLAVEKAVAAGLVVICSAGDLGVSGGGSVTSPGNAPSAVTVGASSDNDSVDKEDDGVSSLSSNGPTAADDVVKPDMAAPGIRIVSVRPYGSLLDREFSEWRISFHGREDYFEMSGTSMAAPMVAGAAALLLEKEPTLNPASVKKRLMDSARPMQGESLMSQGAGTLDVTAALEADACLEAAPSPTALLDPDGEVGALADPAGLYESTTAETGN
jgi:serine protease AprX